MYSNEGKEIHIFIFIWNGGDLQIFLKAWFVIFLCFTIVNALIKRNWYFLCFETTEQIHIKGWPDFQAIIRNLEEVEEPEEPVSYPKNTPFNV